MTRYKLIEGFDGAYRVGDDGTIWSSRRRWASGETWHQIIPRRDKDGYLKVNLYQNRAVRTRLVHRLVLTTFVGDCPPGHECCHLNGIRDDNRLANLKWATPKENASHKILHGTTNRGESHGMAKLTAEQVKEIRRRYSNGEVGAALAREFRVSDQAISAIVCRHRWAYLP